MNARLKRRNRTWGDVGYKTSGGMLDLFDNAIKDIFRVNDAEYDFICENTTEEELTLIANEHPTYAEKRQLLTLMDRLMNQYEESKS